MMSKFQNLSVLFNKATLRKVLDFVKTDRLYVLPGVNVTETKRTLNFYDKSQPSFGHVEAVLYFAKKFRLPCRFLRSKETKTVQSFIDLGHSLRLGHRSSSLPDWQSYSPIVLESYDRAMISPVTTIPVNDGSFFNAMSLSVSKNNW